MLLKLACRSLDVFFYSKNNSPTSFMTGFGCMDSPKRMPGNYGVIVGRQKQLPS